MASKIDLHTHSTVSDGVLSPADLVLRAVERGVCALALTDHDTTAGLPAAQEAAGICGVVLIPGVEISVTWSGRTFHIVGLGIDAENAALQNGLARIRSIRRQRAREMAHKLERAGMGSNLWAEVCELAQGELVGRAHFARLLVRRGLVRDPNEAFRRYLGSGRPGCVEVRWANLDEAMDWIHQAGGSAVFAHPLQYRYPSAVLKRMLEAFVGAGGDAIEVVTGGSNAEQIAAATAHARRLGLAGSLGSDFHTPDQPWNDLGRISPLPECVTPVWKRWSWLPETCLTEWL